MSVIQSKFYSAYSNITYLHKKEKYVNIIYISFIYKKNIIIWYDNIMICQYPNQIILILFQNERNTLIFY